MVVHYDDIILERCLLRQGTLYGILDGLNTIEDGNNDRSLYIEILFVEVNILILSSIHQCAHLTQMSRTGLFHFNLHLTIGRIHVVELFLA